MQQFGTISINDRLATKVLGADYATKRIVKKVYVPKGASKYPLEVVLETRRLHEQERLSYQQVCNRINEHGYIVSVECIKNWCEYITRIRAEPAKQAAPYLPIKVTFSV